MSHPLLSVRPFSQGYAKAVLDLFVAVNAELAPPHLKGSFDAYVAQSVTEEIGRIEQYYSERNGGFWVAVCGGSLVGMYGLEGISADVMELRRMYVASAVRRRGIGRLLLHFAETECRRRGAKRIILSTSELQQPALALYSASGYQLISKERSHSRTNKTIGGGVLRCYFSKVI